MDKNIEIVFGCFVSGIYYPRALFCATVKAYFNNENTGAWYVVKEKCCTVQHHEWHLEWVVD